MRCIYGRHSQTWREEIKTGSPVDNEGGSGGERGTYAEKKTSVDPGGNPTDSPEKQHRDPLLGFRLHVASVRNFEIGGGRELGFTHVQGWL